MKHEDLLDSLRYIKETTNYSECYKKNNDGRGPLYKFLEQPDDNTVYGWIKRFSFGENIEIKEVIYSGPATIVKWEDGTKTVVKCMEDEPYSKENGLMWAIATKLYGKSGLRKLTKKWCVEDELTDEEECTITKFLKGVLQGLAAEDKSVPASEPSVEKKHKYINKYCDANGKWVYVYPKKKAA